MSPCVTGPWSICVEAFLSSTLSVAVAEIGDKTQLLSFVLASRFRARWSILLGILLATLVNHGLSAWLGEWLAGLLPAQWLQWGVALSFIAVGLWILVPDKDDTGESRWFTLGAFGATLVLFFLAEIGDKTQVATVILAAKYQAMTAVVVGTTLGMLLANVPVVWAGQLAGERLPLATIRMVAAGLFIALGVATLFW